MVQIITTAPLMITIISRPVSRVMSWIIIYLGLLLPTASSDLPESKPGKLITFFLVLLRMGFTCAPVVTNKAVVSYTALPPLLLWQAKTAVYFCCTGLGVTSTGRYPASCPVKPGLSSSALPRYRKKQSLFGSKRSLLLRLSSLLIIPHYT